MNENVIASFYQVSLQSILNKVNVILNSFEFMHGV